MLCSHLLYDQPWVRSVDEKLTLQRLLSCTVNSTKSFCIVLAAEHLLQRDFLSLLPSELRLRILQNLDARDLCAVEGVCQAWNHICHAHGSELWGRLCALNGWDPQVG